MAETASLKRADFYRRRFYDESVLDFQQQIQAHQQLLLRTELTFPEFLKIFLSANSVGAVYFSKGYAVEELNEENEVQSLCESFSVKIYSEDQATLVSESDLPFAVAEMPFVFTSFRKKVEDKLIIESPAKYPPSWPEALVDIKALDSLRIKANSESSLKKLEFQGGEAAGLNRLKHYIWTTKAVQNYKMTRNGLLNFDDSMKISPWLNLGCVSARTIYSEIKKFEAEILQNESTYWVVFELLWRDYFKFFSLKYGSSIFKLQGVNFEKKYTCYKNEKVFKNWCEGHTPDSFINANMNELNSTGWMSNRGRQNVASYLVHQLGLPWTWGASYFEKMLIDYDPDVNWGNWLYLSGQGSDPRARKFDVERQVSMYDPSGDYQKKWTS